MKIHIGSVISREEASIIVFHSIGRHTTEYELDDTIINEFEPSPITEEAGIQQQMEIPLYADGGSPTRRVIIYKNGAVEYKNWSGRSYPLVNPFEVYKFIISKEKEFKQLLRN